jgi:hypothetical protein
MNSSDVANKFEIDTELLNGTLLHGYRLANPCVGDLLDSAMPPEARRAPTYVPVPELSEIHTAVWVRSVHVEKTVEVML